MKGQTRPRTATKKANLSQEEKQLRQLASSVGDFIHYWGFRRIHGQIWTELYLSRQALSGAQLVRLLRVSKALVSPALSELEQYGLIRLVGGDAKTKQYAAEAEVFKIIRQIIKERESKLVQSAQEEFLKLEGLARASHSSIDPERLAALGEMIASATGAIEMILELTRDGEWPQWPPLLVPQQAKLK